MAHCPTCNTELPENHPALTLEKLLAWVEVNGGWEGAVPRLRLGKTLALGDGSAIVEVVAYKSTYDSGDIDVENYYGESALPQGSEFEGYIIFKIGEIFYKKTGRGDSYGEVDWDGDIKQVQAFQKTVWEFK